MKKFLLLCLGAAALAASAQTVPPATSSVMATATTRPCLAAASGTWIDKAATAFSAGDGSAENPYKIATPEELAKIAADMSDGSTTYKNTYFELAADIDLGDAVWYPIGFKNDISDVQFSGVFDGKGHSISNLYTEEMEGYSAMGLFGQTSGEAEIRNLTVKSGSVIGEKIVGAIVGYNCGLVENCTNYADVACTMMYSGGIAGSNSRNNAGEETGRIRQCVNYGKITTGTGNNGMCAAGIAGGSTSVIEECANFGDVAAITATAGGITSTMEGGTVSDCFNRGNVTAPEQTGGIVGSMLGRTGTCDVANCYSASDCESKQGNGAIVGVIATLGTTGGSVKSTYYNSDLFSGEGIGTLMDFMGTYEVEDPVSMTTDEMKDPSFIGKLNGTGNAWATDDNQLNDGMPVLAFMNSGTTAIKTATAAAGFSVNAADGRITVEGAGDGTGAKVYTASGTLVYSGATAGLPAQNFAAGLYIVSVNGQSQKVVVR